MNINTISESAIEPTHISMVCRSAISTAHPIAFQSPCCREERGLLQGHWTECCHCVLHNVLYIRPHVCGQGHLQQNSWQPWYRAIIYCLGTLEWRGVSSTVNTTTSNQQTLIDRVRCGILREYFSFFCIVLFNQIVLCITFLTGRLFCF